MQKYKFIISFISAVFFSCTAVHAQIYLYDRTEEHPSVSVNLDVIDDYSQPYGEYRQQPLLFPSVNRKNIDRIVLVPDGDFDNNGNIILTPPGHARPARIEQSFSYDDSFLLVPPSTKTVAPKPLKRPESTKSLHKYVSKKKQHKTHKKYVAKKHTAYKKHSYKAKPAYNKKTATPKQTYIKASKPESLLPRISEEKKTVIPEALLNSKIPEEPVITSRPEPKEVIKVASRPVYKALDNKAEILFEQDRHNLKDEEKEKLESFINKVNNQEGKFLRLMAYASAKDGNAGKARRLSLSRALAVRSHLMDKGVHSTKIEVRALGNKAKKGNFDRVDVTLIKR